MQFNGIDLVDYGATLQSVDPFVLSPALQTTTIQVPGGAALSYGSSFLPWEFDAVLLVEGATFEALESNCNALAAVLDPALGECRIDLDTFTDRYWTGRVNGPLTVTQWLDTARLLTVSFLCSDPRATAL